MWDRKIFETDNENEILKVLSELCGIERKAALEWLETAIKFCLNYVG